MITAGRALAERSGDRQARAELLGAMLASLGERPFWSVDAFASDTTGAYAVLLPVDGDRASDLLAACEVDEPGPRELGGRTFVALPLVPRSAGPACTGGFDRARQEWASAVVAAPVVTAPEGGLSGRVLVAGSAASPSSTMEIWGDGRTPATRGVRRELAIAADGTFAVEGLPPGAYWLCPWDPAQGRSPVPLAMAPCGSRGLLVYLPPTSEVAVEVRDPAGRPVAGAAVNASRYLSPFASLAPQPPVWMTGSDGTVRLSLRAGASYLVWATSPGHCVSSMARVDLTTGTASPDAAELVIAPGGTVRGSLHDTEGLPLAGFIILLLPRPASGAPPPSAYPLATAHRPTPVGHDGTFELEYLPPGRQRVCVYDSEMYGVLTTWTEVETGGERSPPAVRLSCPRWRDSATKDAPGTN